MHELELLESYMTQHFKNDIPTDKITHVHFHSDNAIQHFKCTRAIEYFTTLICDIGGPTVCSYVWSFGAPRHSKGFFDGVGGILKNAFHSLIKGTKSSGETIAGTLLGYITTSEDVYSALKEYFGANSQHRQKKGKNQIDKFEFFYFGTYKNPVHCAEGEEFISLEKMSLCYQFLVSNAGLVHSRVRSGWCIKCYTALTSDSSGWQVMHSIHGCTLSSGQLTTIYNFDNRSCTKLKGAGTVIEIQQCNETQNEMASALTPGS
eukprot:391502-Ditylum_brightwellii.AAC.1